MTLDDNITDERKAIDELRRRLKGLMTEDMYEDDSVFQRFLRARNYNLDASEEMLSNHAKWRKLYNLDDILNCNTHETLRKYGTLNRLGIDRDGAPVSYCAFGNLDIKGMAKCLRKSDLNTFMMKHFEADVAIMKEQSAKRGKNIDKWVYIFNYENFSLSNATDKITIEFLVYLLKTYDGNYPERLKAAYLVNASFYFTLIYAVIKPFLSVETTKKIKIYGNSGWQDELAKELGPDCLPAFLGGNRTDPDGNPKCNTMINHGGPIPKRYFVYQNKSVHKHPGAKRMTINRRSKAELRFDITKPNTRIDWEIDLKTRDITYNLVYKEDEHSNGQHLLPEQRLSNLATESGTYHCEKLGIYTIVFDNSYSWMSNKEIIYNVSMTTTPQKAS